MQPKSALGSFFEIFRIIECKRVSQVTYLGADGGGGAMTLDAGDPLGEASDNGGVSLAP